MGIYVIKSKYNNWIKIGHHKITERKPNIYFRYINRGFYSCITNNFNGILDIPTKYDFNIAAKWCRNIKHIKI